MTDCMNFCYLSLSVFFNFSHVDSIAWYGKIIFEIIGDRT